MHTTSFNKNPIRHAPCNKKIIEIINGIHEMFIKYVRKCYVVIFLCITSSSCSFTTLLKIKILKTSSKKKKAPLYLICGM